MQGRVLLSKQRKLFGLLRKLRDEAKAFVRIVQHAVLFARFVEQAQEGGGVRARGLVGIAVPAAVFVLVSSMPLPFAVKLKSPSESLKPSACLRAERLAVITPGCGRLLTKATAAGSPLSDSSITVASRIVREPVKVGTL